MIYTYPALAILPSPSPLAGQGEWWWHWLEYDWKQHGLNAVICYIINVFKFTRNSMDCFYSVVLATTMYAQAFYFKTGLQESTQRALTGHLWQILWTWWMLCDGGFCDSKVPQSSWGTEHSALACCLNVCHAHSLLVALLPVCSLTAFKVRTAIHAAPVEKTGPWVDCTTKINYKETVDSLLPIYPTLM